MVLGDGLPVVACEGQVSGGRPVARHAERREIIPPVDLPAARLFRAAVMRGTHDLIRGTYRGSALECSSQTEIRDDRVPRSADQNVVGLDSRWITPPAWAMASAAARRCNSSSVLMAA